MPHELTNRSYRVVLALTIALTLAAAPQAFGAVYATHDTVFGPGSVTRDSGSGLDWLDISHTLNRSYADVAGQLVIGGEYEGWRHATLADLSGLTSNLGITAVPANPNNVTPQPLLNAIQLLSGREAIGLSNDSVGGEYDDGNANPEVGWHDYIYVASGPGGAPLARMITEPDVYDPTDNFAFTASWLVRDTQWMHPVTYLRTATLDDGSKYAYEVSFDPASLDGSGNLTDADSWSSLAIWGGTQGDSYYTDDQLFSLSIGFGSYTPGALPETWDLWGQNDNNIIQDSSIPFLFDNVIIGESGNLVNRGVFVTQDTSQWILLRDATVPEPTTATLGLLGVGGLLMRRRRAAFILQQP